MNLGLIAEHVKHNPKQKSVSPIINKNVVGEVKTMPQTKKKKIYKKSISPWASNKNIGGKDKNSNENAIGISKTNKGSRS